METKIDYSHHLLQSRPNFAKALKDFETFLLATTEDLQNKFKVLDAQKTNRKTSRNIKTYLSLQNYLLNKHLTRLHEFQNEIYTRVSLVFQQENLKQNGADEQFLSILADMSKMKTRCKHILDVTDRYCVLTETCPTISRNSSVDDETKEDSIDSTDTTDSTGSVVKLRGNVVKTTVSSLSSHLAVIAKTYTKRHSSSNLNQTT